MAAAVSGAGGAGGGGPPGGPRGFCKRSHDRMGGRIQTYGFEGSHIFNLQLLTRLGYPDGNKFVNDSTSHLARLASVG